MSKSVLISIKPEWCEKILNGEKIIEVRKTKPKIDTPFKCYIYCTNSGRPLVYGDKPCMSGWRETYTQTYGYNRDEAERIWGVLNGKVIGEFVCDKIFPLSFYMSDVSYFDTVPPFTVPGTCLTDKEIAEYLGNGKTGYGWHISDLKIYDKPKELSEFCKPCNWESKICFTCERLFIACDNEIMCDNQIKRPPQSWCYVEEAE